MSFFSLLIARSWDGSEVIIWSFGIACDDLNSHMLQPREEESLADTRFKQKIFFFVGQIEGLLQHINRRRRLLQQ